MAILRDLRLGQFDVLVGINLLREGPRSTREVGLVGILDADREGFLRNQTSLIQTIGRAARNADGRVILYADKRKSIVAALEETQRRRQLQLDYNQRHGIVPKTVTKPVSDLGESNADVTPSKQHKNVREHGVTDISELNALIEKTLGDVGGD